METKTQHLRRMRLRRKYWRVTPTSERITINPKGENVMSKLTIDASDDELEKGIVAARAMLAALERVLPAVEAVRDQDLANDLNDEGDVAAILEAIAAAKAAGIGEE